MSSTGNSPNKPVGTQFSTLLRCICLSLNEYGYQGSHPGWRRFHLPSSGTLGADKAWETRNCLGKIRHIRCCSSETVFTGRFPLVMKKSLQYVLLKVLVNQVEVETSH
ncbi:hypothetical protein VNO77_44306 [Canavalia gladiata]|uniref:Uncharacterized protein n=1 Tax=Canavalia gladiata TaxID=3824 RepID=A0AAN9JVS0_CANGL